MRRLFIAVGILGVLAVIWAGGWFAAAAWAKGRVATVLARIAERGIEVQCDGRDIVGFPFALRVACGETSVAEGRSGTRADLAGVTGGASVFSPMTADIALASPARVQSPLVGAPVELSWDDADLAVDIGVSGPQAVSFETEEISAAHPEGTVTAAHAAGALAPAEDGGTDAEVAFTGLAFAAGDQTFPPVDGRASARLSVPPRALLAGRAALQAPLSANAIDVSLSSGDARLEATGDVSVDAEGILDGALTVRIAGTEALSAFIAALPEEHQKLGNAMAGGLLIFGRPAELDGAPASELTLEITRGQAKIGPVDVTLPRVPL